MFTEPITVTIDGSATSFTRISTSEEVDVRLGQFRSADGAYTLSINSQSMGPDLTRYEVTLMKCDLGTVLDRMRRNGVGIVLYVDTYRDDTSTQVPLLRTAISTWLDSTLQGRVLAGEN